MWARTSVREIILLQPKLARMDTLATADRSIFQSSPERRVRRQFSQ
jgi:hypothetical protein